MSAPPSHARPLILGIGNPLRGDDGAGRLLAERLGSACPPGAFECRTLDGEVASILEAWTGRRLAIVVDAAASGAPPGTIRRFDATAGPLPAIFETVSTHGFGLPEAIELGRALGRLPGRLIVYAVEGGAYGTGEKISPEIERAIELLTKRIGEDLEEASITSTGTSESFTGEERDA